MNSARALRSVALAAAGLALVAGPAAASAPRPTPPSTVATPTPPPASDDAVIPPGPRAITPDPTAYADSSPIVDVVVGWTASAEAAAVGGAPAIRERIAHGIDDANASFARSGINVRLNLVATARGIGTDPGNGEVLLGQLVNRLDGQWDNLTNLMEREGADLLSVYAGPGLDNCGQAYYPEEDGAYAFSVINSECAVGDQHVFAHEIGHNLGAGHERGTGWDAFVPAYGYGYSYTNAANPSANFHTVMSYGNACWAQQVWCDWIGYFSNPEVFYRGHATGVAIGKPNAADNRTVINTWAPMVANYRSAPNAGVRGDWTGEGDVDLLGRNTNGNLYLYRGNGTGRVASGTQVDGAWGGYNYLGSPGDITGDKRTDLIGRDAAGAMFVWPGRARGQLGEGRRIGSSWGAMNILATPGDMDLDGRPDLVARRMDNTLHSYTFRADGSMRYVAQIGTGWGQMKWIIGMGDLDGDKRGDVVGVNHTDGCLYAYNTKVVGGLPRLALKGRVGCGWGAMTWLTSSGDVNKDGLGDLTARRSDGTLWFYPGRAGGGVRSGIQVGSGWNGMAQIL